MESSPDRTDEACWYRAVIFQNITASVRPRFYWEIESFSGCGCNPDGHLPSIAGGVDQWRAVDRKHHLLTGCAYRLLLYTTEPGWKISLDSWHGRDEDRFRFLEGWRSEEHTSELQSLMRISYAVFCLKKKKKQKKQTNSRPNI